MCSTGGRAAMAVNLLAEAGFDDGEAGQIFGGTVARSIAFYTSQSFLM
jgi:hypothetical protein